MRIHVSEYRLEVKQCPCCGKSCSGTSPIASNVGYGPGIKSIASYLNIYQMLPFARIQEFFSDVFNHSVSGGFLQSCNQQHYDALALSEQGIKDALSKSPWIAADETSSRCMGKNNWVHVAGNATHTHYHADTKRGSDAIGRAGVIQGYQGVVSHDRYASYDKFELTHQLCCVHLLRELRFLFEEKDIRWAKSLYEWLLWANGFKKSGSITDSDRALVEKNYDFIVETANLSTPRAEKSPKSRGKPKQSAERNLLDAFIERKDDILRFMYNAHAPFDNNQAERDLRMIKVKQKISGCFRTEKGLKVFCRIGSYISTARKQGLDVLDALIMAMKGTPHFA